MIWVLDIVFLILTVVFLFLKNPALAIIILLVNLLFYFQLGKSILLQNKDAQPLQIKQRAKAMIVALFLGAIFCSVFPLAPPAEVSTTVEYLWNDDVFPLFIGVSILCALLMVSMIIERRRR